MKIILTLSLLLNVCSATTYYVKVGGGTGSGRDADNAWNFSKFNSSALSAGDSVKFRRGETYYGSFSIPNGVAANVVYDAWDSGLNPIISGFTTLTNWTLSSGSIYYTSLDVPSLNEVTLDGVARAKGRYPNTGYLSYESHNANTSITDNTLSGTPSWVGGELVIKKVRYIIDRHIITAQSGGTLTYNATRHFGDNISYSPVDGNGYFVQGHLSTLDLEGEWYYDAGAKRLYMHFGKTKPTARVVKASTVDKIISSNMSSYITFNNIDFQGGNNAFYNTGANNIKFNNCNFIQQARDALYGADCHTIAVNGGSIVNPSNNAAFFENNCNYISFNNVFISSAGTIAGMGASGDGSYNAIALNGNNNAVTGCTIKSTGFNAISYAGDNMVVEKNLIDSFCLVKDDGGGVYTINYLNANLTSGIIRNNIILNAIGTFVGAESYYYEAFGKAAGIYLDDRTNHTTIENNVVANGSWFGIFLCSKSANNTINNNTVYNYMYQMVLAENGLGSIRDNIVTNNKFIAKTTAQKTMHISMNVSDDPGLFANFNYNHYSRPIDDNLTININKSYSGGGSSDISFANWQSISQQDAQSRPSQVIIDNLKKIRFDYNYSPSTTMINLNPNYWKDVTGTFYNGSVSLPPYGGSVLCQSAASIVGGATGLNRKKLARMASKTDFVDASRRTLSSDRRAPTCIIN